MKDLLDSDAYDFCFDVGLGFPISSMRFADRDEFVQSLAGYFTVVKVKAQIDQLTQGPRVLGVLELVQANSHKARELFIYSEPEHMTADAVLALFTPRLSLEGSNRREDEEQMVMLWVDFLQKIESKLESLETETSPLKNNTLRY